MKTRNVKKIQKLKKKLKAAELETDLFADLIVRFRDELEKETAFLERTRYERDMARTELEGVQAMCERAQADRDLAKVDERDASEHALALDDIINAVRAIIWDGNQDMTQTLYRVRQLIPNTAQDK